jgi:hypothetical protein
MGILYFWLKQEFWKDKSGEEILPKVVLEEKKKK